MSSTPDHYLKAELLQKLQDDPRVIDWIETGSLDGLWYWDLEDGEQEWQSPRFKAMFGYEDHEIANTTAWWQANIHPDDLSKALDNFNQHAADPNHPYDQIVRYKHKDGSWIWVRCRGLILRNAQGIPTRMLGAHTDLTAIMQSQNLLEQTQRQLTRSLEVNELVLRASKMGIWELDIATGYLHWDKQMHAMYEIAPHDFKHSYQDWLQFIADDDAQQLTKAISDCQQGISLEMDLPLRLASGQAKIVHMVAQLYYNRQGEAKRLVGSCRDITRERYQERQLHEKNKDLETFAYVASHDLKAPLRAVKQIAGWIKEDLPTDNVEIAENFNLLATRITRMEDLLDGLLGYSRASQLPAQAMPVDCQALVQSVIDLYQEDYLIFEIANPLPILTTYKVPLEIILRNLIGNAIKHNFSTLKKIWIYCKKTSNDWQFCVVDNGEGIPEIYHEKVMAMFQKLLPKDKVEGAGMGLAICNRYLAQMGGKMWFATQQDKENFNLEREIGAAVCFTLPEQLYTEQVCV